MYKIQLAFSYFWGCHVFMVDVSFNEAESRSFWSMNFIEVRGIRKLCFTSAPTLCLILVLNLTPRTLML